MKKHFIVLFVGVAALTASDLPAYSLFSRFRPNAVLKAIQSQQAQDVKSLLDREFYPENFTAEEVEIQGRVTAVLEAARAEFSRTWGYETEQYPVEHDLKEFVIDMLRKLILSERNNEREFQDNIEKLGTVLAAFKSDDGEQTNTALEAFDFFTPGSNEDPAPWWNLWNHVEHYRTTGYDRGLRGGIRKAGEYIEIQLAEASKDMRKASLQLKTEILARSTLAEGGLGFRLVYSCCGLDSGRNHITGLPNADFWHEGQENWSRVAAALERAIQWAQAHPVTSRP